MQNNSRPSRMICHRTTFFRILLAHSLPLLLSLQRHAVFSFAPAFYNLPLNRPTARGRTFSPAVSAVGGILSTELSAFATADAEEVHRPKDNNKNNHNHKDNSSSWTAVEGGFLPRFKPPAKKAPAVQEVQSLQDYKKIVVQEPEKITVVRFYAPWCRACKAVKSKYVRLSRQYSSNPAYCDKVQFVEVPLTKESAVLHTGLGVPSLPYGHIYYPQAGLVEERKMNKHVFKEFETVLETYVQGYCNVEYKEDGSTAWLP